MTPPWYYRLRVTNWVIARPWRVYPISKKGWRYAAVYRDLRAYGDFYRFRPWGRLRATWGTITFPHVHHRTED